MAALILELNERRTEIMWLNSFTGRIVQNVVKSSFCLSFFPTITSKYLYQLPEKTLFLSGFDFLGVRDTDFQDI